MEGLVITGVVRRARVPLLLAQVSSVTSQVKNFKISKFQIQNMNIIRLNQIVCKLTFTRVTFQRFI